MLLEELFDYRNNVWVDDGGKERDKGGQHAPKRSDRYKENQGFRFHTCTHLNADRGKLWMRHWIPISSWHSKGYKAQKTLIRLGNVDSTATLATRSKSVKHWKTRLKNLYKLGTCASSSRVWTEVPIDPLQGEISSEERTKGSLFSPSSW